MVNIELQGLTLPKATQSPQVSYVHSLPVDYTPSDRNSLKSMLPSLSPSQSQEGSEKHLVCYLRYSFCISNHIHWFQTSFVLSWTFMHSGKKALVLGSSVTGLHWSYSPFRLGILPSSLNYRSANIDRRISWTGSAEVSVKSLCPTPFSVSLLRNFETTLSSMVLGSFSFSTLWLSWPYLLTVRFDS